MCERDSDDDYYDTWGDRPKITVRQENPYRRKGTHSHYEFVKEAQFFNYYGSLFTSLWISTGSIL